VLAVPIDILVYQINWELVFQTKAERLDHRIGWLDGQVDRLLSVVEVVHHREQREPGYAFKHLILKRLRKLHSDALGTCFLQCLVHGDSELHPPVKHGDDG
jgi:hypothetical protein